MEDIIQILASLNWKEIIIALISGIGIGSFVTYYRVTKNESYISNRHVTAGRDLNNTNTTINKKD